MSRRPRPLANSLRRESEKHPRSLFCDNADKFGHILILLSLLHSRIKCGRGCCIVYHLASNLLPHYFTLRNVNVQLYKLYRRVSLLNLKCARLFICSKWQSRTKCHVVDSCCHACCLCILIYNISVSVLPSWAPNASNHWHWITGYVDDVLFNAVPK